jgi:hypothetical protein
MHDLGALGVTDEGEALVGTCLRLQLQSREGVGDSYDYAGDIFIGGVLCCSFSSSSVVAIVTNLNCIPSTSWHLEVNLRHQLVSHDLSKLTESTVEMARYRYDVLVLVLLCRELERISQLETHAQGISPTSISNCEQPVGTGPNGTADDPTSAGRIEANDGNCATAIARRSNVKKAHSQIAFVDHMVTMSKLIGFRWAWRALPSSALASLQLSK